MKAAVLDSFPDLPGLVTMLLYETKPVHFLSVYYNAIEWIQKTRQVYEPETKMVHDAHLLHINVEVSYNYNMNSVNISDQLLNLYQVDHWMRK